MAPGGKRGFLTGTDEAGCPEGGHHEVGQQEGITCLARLPRPLATAGEKGGKLKGAGKSFWEGKNKLFHCFQWA